MQKRLTGFDLKVIAVVTMLIDHIGYVFCSDMPRFLYNLCRYIGRTAFPLFAFLLVEGFIYTHNRFYHCFLLCLFCILSEIPFNLMIGRRVFYSHSQNILLTLLIAFIAMWVLDYSLSDVCSVKFFFVIIFIVLAKLCKTDYASFGVVTVLCFYLVYRLKNYYQIHDDCQMFVLYFLSLTPLYLYGIFIWEKEFACVSALPFLCLYNGERGRKMKYFFYLFYPLHMLLLFGIWKLRILFFHG